jgi:DNA ligase-1
MKDEIEADGEIIGFKPGKEDSAFAHTRLGNYSPGERC